MARATGELKSRAARSPDAADVGGSDTNVITSSDLLSRAAFDSGVATFDR
jgi:hypothetical protein